MTAGDLWELLREVELVRDIAWVLTNADEQRGCEEAVMRYNHDLDDLDARYHSGYEDGYEAGYKDGEYDTLCYCDEGSP